jgi:phospholipase C
VLLDPATGAVSSIVPTRPHWPTPPRGGWAERP